MKILVWSVGIGVSLAFVAPAFGKENPGWTDSVSEATQQHFLLAQALNQTGTVQWYDDAKGFGFIAPDTGAKNVIVRSSELQGSGLSTLTPGLKVIYDVNDGPKGPSAANVRVR